MPSVTIILPLVLAAAASASQLTTTYNVTDPKTACDILKQTYPNITYLPEDAGYADENQGQSGSLSVSDK